VNQVQPVQLDQLVLLERLEVQVQPVQPESKVQLVPPVQLDQPESKVQLVPPVQLDQPV
jgi:hypothetical protein